MIKNEQGFSFAELMTVIAIVGILSAIALPNFLRSLPEKRLKNAARNLYADLQRARLLAVKENRRVDVLFNINDNDSDNNTYHFEDDPSSDTEYGNWNSDEFGKKLADYGEVYYGCTADKDLDADTRVTFVNNAVQFTNTGTANQGTVYLQYLPPENDQEVCYSVNVTTFGGIKIERIQE